MMDFLFSNFSGDIMESKADGYENSVTGLYLKTVNVSSINYI